MRGVFARFCLLLRTCVRRKVWRRGELALPGAAGAEISDFHVETSYYRELHALELS